MRLRFIPLTGLLLSLAFSAHAQTRLNIPTNAAEMRQYMRDFDNYCPTCATVTNVRTLDSAGREVEYSGVAGPEDVSGNKVLLQPLLSSNKISTHIPASTQWRVTVRYDNGAFAVFDQLQQPNLAKGDLVTVVEGRLERR
jgi:hypothetical protein